MALASFLENSNDAQHDPKWQDTQEISEDGHRPLEGDTTLVCPDQGAQQTTLEFESIPIMLQIFSAEFAVRYGHISSIEVVLRGSMVEERLHPGPCVSVERRSSPLTVDLAALEEDIGSSRDQNASDAQSNDANGVDSAEDDNRVLVASYLSHDECQMRDTERCNNEGRGKEPQSQVVRPH